jgi:hypothetical protein
VLPERTSIFTLARPATVIHTRGTLTRVIHTGGTGFWGKGFRGLGTDKPVPRLLARGGSVSPRNPKRPYATPLPYRIGTTSVERIKAWFVTTFVVILITIAVIMTTTVVTITTFVVMVMTTFVVTATVRTAATSSIWAVKRLGCRPSVSRRPATAWRIGQGSRPHGHRT